MPSPLTGAPWPVVSGSSFPLGPKEKISTADRPCGSLFRRPRGFRPFGPSRPLHMIFRPALVPLPSWPHPVFVASLAQGPGDGWFVGVRLFSSLNLMVLPRVCVPPAVSRVLFPALLCRPI